MKILQKIKKLVFISIPSNCNSRSKIHKINKKSLASFIGRCRLNGTFFFILVLLTVIFSFNHCGNDFDNNPPEENPPGENPDPDPDPNPDPDPDPDPNPPGPNPNPPGPNPNPPGPDPISIDLLPYSASIENSKSFEYTLTAADSDSAMSSRGLTLSINGLDPGDRMKVSLKEGEEEEEEETDILCDLEVSDNFQASCTISEMPLQAETNVYLHIKKSTSDQRYFTVNYGKGDIGSPYILSLNHELEKQRLPLGSNLYFKIKDLDPTKGYMIKNTRFGRPSTSLEAFHRKNRAGTDYRLLACKTNLAHEEGFCKLTGVTKLFLKLVTNKFHWTSFQSSIKVEEFALESDDILPQGTPGSPFELNFERNRGTVISDLKMVHNSKSYYKLAGLPTRGGAYSLDIKAATKGGGASRLNFVLYTDTEFSTLKRRCVWPDRLSQANIGIPYEVAVEHLYWPSNDWKNNRPEAVESVFYMRASPLGGESGLKFTLSISNPSNPTNCSP